MDRLDTGLAQLGIQTPEPRAAMAADITRLARAAQVPGGACRVLVTAGPPRGRPMVLLQVEVRVFPDHPLRLISYRALRSAADLKAKTFTTSYLAQQAAAAAGADDALFVDELGQAHEATTANLFLYRRDELLTPPLDGSILPGVVRGQVMRLAGSDGIPVREAHIVVGDLTAADTLLLTSSVRGIVLAASIDGRALDIDGGIGARLRGLLATAEADSAAAFRTAYAV
jgi:branched-chain amino acid aminotransferase